MDKHSVGDKVAVLVLPKGTTHYAIIDSKVILLKDTSNLGMMYYDWVKKGWTFLGWDVQGIEARPVDLIAKYIKKEGV